MRLPVLLAAIALVAAPAIAQMQGVTPAGLTFHASFEDGLDADFAAAGGTATPEGAPEITEGHRGQGLLVGDLDGSAGVWYPAPGNFGLQRGSMAMWVQPVNWRGSEEGNRLFFNGRPDPAGLFSFYKYFRTSWGLTLLIDPDGNPRGKTVVYEHIDEWQPGEWHHIAATWQRYEGLALYIDGEQVEHKAGSGISDAPVQDTMRFGGSWDKDGNRTVIDELMIFDRMLAPWEIATLAGLQVEPPAITELTDIPGVMLAHSYLDEVVLARVYADALGERVADSAQLTLTPADGGEPIVQTTADLKREGLNELKLDLSRIDHGLYVARVGLIADGTSLGSEALDVQHEVDSTWTQAHALGRVDRVLKPFEALEVGGNVIAVAERDYTMGEGGLLAGAVAHDEELLAGPVRLIATTADGEVDLANRTFNLDRLSETTAVGTGTLTGTGLSVTNEVSARYDGTLWTELGIVANRNTELSALRIEVPLRPEVAQYLAWWAPRWVDARRWGYGAMPEGEGSVWSREFLPSLWIGNADRGMGWFAESDEGWDAADEGAITIERRPDETVLCMNVIREPRTLTEPLKVQFGLQATPVRALADDWRSYQWVPSTDISRFLLGLAKRPFEEREIAEDESPRGKVCYLYTHHKYFTNTLPRDPAEFREMIARAKDYGLFTIPYTEARLLPEDRGDFILHDEEMPTIPWVRASGYGPHVAVGCCMKGPFSDWLVWYCSHMIDAYGTNGVYFDELQPMPCMNEAHGCGYVGADGQRHVTYPMRDFLETMRRVRTVFEETGEPYWITYHISAGRTAPMPTFGDDLLMAEERNPVVGKNPDYTQNTTPAEWLASFSPESWGIPPVVIPQFKMNAEWMKDPALAQTLMAAVVPHDLMVWPVFSDTDTIMGLRTRLMEFGIGEPDTRFVGHWEADAPVQCADTRVKCSAYVRPGKVMLCIGNWSDDTIGDLQVTLDLQALGLPAQVTARNAMTDESVAVDGGIARIGLEPKRLTLVEIE